MPEFKITAVSQEVRSFNTKFGDMKSYKLKLEGVDAVVELAQKESTPAPTAGQTLTGSIDYTGQYGPKFKKENPAYGGGSSGGNGSKPSYQPKDEKSIHAQMAIKAAVQAMGTIGETDEDVYTDKVFSLAKGFYSMIDLVKDSDEVKEPTAPVQDAFAMPKDDFDKPVDLSEIPF